jgi:hypothetical protein
MALERLFQEPLACDRLVLRSLRRQRLSRHLLAATGSTKIAGVVIASQRTPGDRAPNLIISTGGDTIASNAILAQQFKCKNVFVGSLRGVSSGLFSAVLHVNPALADQFQHWIGLKPAPIDPDRPFSSDGLPNRYAALLLGGPTKAEPFEGESLPIALRAMAAFAQTTDCLGSRLNHIQNAMRAASATADRKFLASLS